MIKLLSGTTILLYEFAIKQQDYKATLHLFT